MNKLLLVEDDKGIVAMLTEFLRSEGFQVKNVSGQSDAIKLCANDSFDLALLDISLSDGNGFALCSAIKANYNMPVIFLTASGDEFSTVTGLEIGADDYIAKPFRPRELISRIKAVIRRHEKSGGITNAGELTVDTVKGTVTKCGVDLNLSALEYRLLLSFINNRGAVLTRSRLLEDIWDVAGEFVNDNTLTVYIKRLRNKIENDPQNPVTIKTVRGLGYKMD